MCGTALPLRNQITGDVQMLTFVLPTEQNREDVLAFYRDIEENGEECIGIGNYKDYDMWLTLI